MTEFPIALASLGAQALADETRIQALDRKGEAV